MSQSPRARLRAPAAVKRRTWLLSGLFLLCVLVIGAAAAATQFGLSRWAAGSVAGAAAVAVASGASKLAGSVRDLLTRVRNANTALAEHFVRWDAEGGPRIADVTDPGELGVTPAAELPGLEAPPDRSPDYVPRTQDNEIHELLRTSNFVLIQGPAKAGKSRSAFEAIRAEFPDRLLLAPKASSRTAVKELDDLLQSFELVLPDTVLWLDGLNRHLGTDGLTIDRLRRLADPRHGRVTVVATMRLEFLDEFPTETDTGRLGSVVLGTARAARLGKQLDTAERTLARQQVSRADRRIAAALLSTVGLAEYLAAVPELRRKMDAGTEKNPAGVAIVRAAIDCRRAGLQRPVPEEILRRLQPVYDAHGHPLDFADGLAWALARVCATVALLSGEQDGYLAFDQLVEDAENTGRQVPEATWRVLLDSVTDPAELFDIGRRAYRAGRRPVAEIAFTRSAAAGDAAGRNGLGVLRHDEGDEQAAESWYRKAVAGGNTHAARNLGMIMMDRGERAEAERLYRQAAEAGNALAMNSLGIVLEGRRETAEAEHWYRGAAEAGNAVAMNNLGLVLEDRGDIDAAHDWYRRAADAGHSSRR
ncbi:MAG TPA: tetratricopeptide repeat protein [Pseudonocardiaceae bacterium]|nr:tetratricopeptide repeat protein [Pseudonocardiaceae bacterium]